MIGKQDLVQRLLAAQCFSLVLLPLLSLINDRCNLPIGTQGGHGARGTAVFYNQRNGGHRKALCYRAPWASIMAQLVKNLPAVQETWV